MIATTILTLANKCILYQNVETVNQALQKCIYYLYQKTIDWWKPIDNFQILLQSHAHGCWYHSRLQHRNQRTHEVTTKKHHQSSVSAKWPQKNTVFFGQMLCHQYFRRIKNCSHRYTQRICPFTSQKVFLKTIARLYSHYLPMNILHISPRFPSPPKMITWSPNRL